VQEICGASGLLALPPMRRFIVLLAFALCALAACSKQASPPPSEATKAPAVASGPVAQAKVFYFGHSLVDQDMPLMVGSLAKARGKTWLAQGQLGRGTPLSAHYKWDGAFGKDAPLGFVDENRGRPFFVGEGKAQIKSGDYDVMVITESNGHTRGDGDETVDYATRLSRIARAARPSIRIFLYSNWLDRKEFANDDTWRTQTERDIKWWESVADRVNAEIEGPDLFIIPGGPILARVTREAAHGKLPGLRVNDLFRGDDGVHVNDRGFYVIALAHYAAIFRDSPVGLPVATETEDGPAETLSPDNAARIQQLVWEVLKGYPRAGIGS
jgi:hypothetical protein